MGGARRCAIVVPKSIIPAGAASDRSAATPACSISANFTRQFGRRDGSKMRWMMLGLTILGFAMAFVARTPGVLAIGLLLGFVGLFGMVFSIASDRIASRARPDTAMLSIEALAALRARREAAAKAAAAARPRAPTNTDQRA